MLAVRKMAAAIPCAFRSETSDFLCKLVQVGQKKTAGLTWNSMMQGLTMKVIPLICVLWGSSPRYFPPETSRQASLYRPSDRWVLPQTKLVEATGAAMPKRPIFVAKLANSWRKNTPLWKGWKCIILIGKDLQNTASQGATEICRRIVRS